MPATPSNPTSPPTEATLRARALRLLGRREYARREMAERLARWGATPDQAGAVLDRLEADGALSDARYAASWVRGRLGRGNGPRRLHHGLAQAGLAEEVIEQALPDEEDWGERLDAARRRRFGAVPPADWPDWGRQARYLERRGYPPELIRRRLPRPAAGVAEDGEAAE
ncbi:MAG: regulatory protein RecX [Candidatus Macondimonas sp.]